MNGYDQKEIKLLQTPTPSFIPLKTNYSRKYGEEMGKM